MKLLVLSQCHWFNIVHGGDRFLNLAKELSKRGHEVTIIYMGKSHAVHPRYLIDLTKVRKLYLQKYPNLNLVVLPDPLGANKFQTLARMLPKMGLALRNVGDFDVVQTDGIFVHPVGETMFMSKLLSKMPQVVDFVDYSQSIPNPGISWKWMYKLGYLPTWSTVVSDYLSVLLQGMGFRRSAIAKIPMGAATGRIENMAQGEAVSKVGLNPKLRYLGYEAGSGVYDEYFEIMFKSLREVSRLEPGVRLLLIGDFSRNYEPRRIVELAKRMGLTDRILFSGRIPTDQLGLWLSACEILLIPLRDDVIDRARLPGRFGDYMAAGRPTVGTEVGEVASILNNGCGIAVESGDVNGFARSVLELLRSPELARTMGDRARRLAETDYSWECISLKLESFYHQIMKQ